MTDLLAGRRRLVIQGEMLVLMKIEMALEDLGCCAIHAAASVAQALDLLRRHRLDAVMLDVNLAGDQSYPVADALIRLGIPFIFSTAYRDHGNRHDLEDRPALRKPCTREALIAVFEHLLPDESLPVAA